MWSLLRKREDMCCSLAKSLEDRGHAASLAPKLQEHLRACSECQAAVDDFLMSRALLGSLPFRIAEPAPWFAPRVMAAIARREAELRPSLDTWLVLPKLASRLTWASALALLLVGSWLYQTPRTGTASPDSTMESLLDPSQAPAVQDDILAGHLEREQ